MAKHDSDDAPRYEKRDVPAILPFEVIVFMVLFVPVGLATVWAIMATAWRVAEEPGPPFEEEPYQLQGPQLQESPAEDYAEFRQIIEKRLNSLGWVDRDAGIVHLPIDQAKHLLIERGLPESDSDASSQSRPPLDPQAATRWLEEGKAARPTSPEQTAPEEVQ